jgi:hypothetical protein
MIFPSDIRGHATEGSQLWGVKPKMGERKLRSDVNWQETLKQKGIKQTGVKEGLGEETTIRHRRRYGLKSN